MSLFTGLYLSSLFVILIRFTISCSLFLFFLLFSRLLLPVSLSVLPVIICFLLPVHFLVFWTLFPFSCFSLSFLLLLSVGLFSSSRLPFKRHFKNVSPHDIFTVLFVSDDPCGKCVWWGAIDRSASNTSFHLGVRSQNLQNSHLQNLRL